MILAVYGKEKKKKIRLGQEISNILFYLYFLTNLFPFSSMYTLSLNIFLLKSHMISPSSYIKSPNFFMWHKQPPMICILTFFSFLPHHFSITIYMPLLQSDICISLCILDVLHIQDIGHVILYA